MILLNPHGISQADNRLPTHHTQTMTSAPAALNLSKSAMYPGRWVLEQPVIGGMNGSSLCQSLARKAFDPPNLRTWGEGAGHAEEDALLALEQRPELDRAVRNILGHTGGCTGSESALQRLGHL